MLLNTYYFNNIMNMSPVKFKETPEKPDLATIPTLS